MQKLIYVSRNSKIYRCDPFHKRKRVSGKRKKKWNTFALITLQIVINIEQVNYVNVLENKKSDDQCTVMRRVYFWKLQVIIATQPHTHRLLWDVPIETHAPADMWYVKKRGWNHHRITTRDLNDVRWYKISMINCIVFKIMSCHNHLETQLDAFMVTAQHQNNDLKPWYGWESRIKLIHFTKRKGFIVKMMERLFDCAFFFSSRSLLISMCVCLSIVTTYFDIWTHISMPFGSCFLLSWEMNFLPVFSKIWIKASLK